MKRSAKKLELLTKIENSPYGFICPKGDLGTLPLLGSRDEVAEFILKEIEAFGVVWEPEKELFPASIYATMSATNPSIPVLCIPGIGGIGEMVSEETYGEAVRRYNDWSKLQDLARTPLGIASIGWIQDQLRAIVLRGKDHPQ